MVRIALRIQAFPARKIPAMREVTISKLGFLLSLQIVEINRLAASFVTLVTLESPTITQTTTTTAATTMTTMITATTNIKMTFTEIKLPAITIG